MKRCFISCHKVTDFSSSVLFTSVIFLWGFNREYHVSSFNEIQERIVKEGRSTVFLKKKQTFPLMPKQSEKIQGSIDRRTKRLFDQPHFNQRTIILSLVEWGIFFPIYYQDIHSFTHVDVIFIFINFLCERPHILTLVHCQNLLCKSVFS